MVWTNNSIYGIGGELGYNTFDSLDSYTFQSETKLSTDTTMYTVSNITHPGPVDFMSGLSLHPDSLTDSKFTISGFTNNYNPGPFGGWSSENVKGDSKLLSMWADTQTNKPIKTSLYTGYVDIDNNTKFLKGELERNR